MIGKDPVGSNMLRFKEQGKKGVLSESCPSGNLGNAFSASREDRHMNGRGHHCRNIGQGEQRLGGYREALEEGCILEGDLK